ncbi:MAG: hypothetical protein ABIT37_12070 [Luteolibacter sp.]
MPIHHHISRFWTGIVVPITIGVIGSLIATWTAQHVEQERRTGQLVEALQQEVLGNAHHLDAVVSESGRKALANIPQRFLFQADFYSYARRDPWVFHLITGYQDYDNVYRLFAELAVMMKQPPTPEILAEIEKRREELHRLIRDRLKLDISHK